MNQFLCNFGRSIVSPSLTLLLAAGIAAPASRAAAETVSVQREGVPTTKMVLPALYAQGVFLKFVLGAYGKSDQQKIQAVKDAETAIEQFAFQTRMIHMVNDRKELEQLRSLYFPRFYSLADELDYRRSAKPPAFFTITPGSHSLEDDLDTLWSRQERRLEAFAHLNTALNKRVSNTTVNTMIFGVLNNPSQVRTGLGLVDDRARLSVADMIHAEMDKGIAQIDSTGRLIADSGSIKHADANMERFFQLAIGEYFRRLDTQEKLNIIAEFIDNPDLSAPSEKFEMMVMNSGPQFQKVFQVYAEEEGFSPEIRAIFKRLQSSIRPAPWRLVEPMIRAERVPFEWLEIDPKPIGVGTMAQNHRARIRLPSGEIRTVAVRVMKPGIAKRLFADNLVLQQMAPAVDADPLLRAGKFPLLTPFINQVIEMGMNELNVPATVAAQKMGGPSYEREVTVPAGNSTHTVRFHVPFIYDLDPKSSVMVQEFVPGRGFDKFAAESPVIARAVVEELARLWTETALLGNGFSTPTCTSAMCSSACTRAAGRR